MSKTLTATFATRREAEMTIERLVQEYAIERTDIFVAADGDENTVGEQVAGSDTEGGEPTASGQEDAALAGQISVSVDIEDEALAERVRSAFTEFDAASIDED